MGNANGKKDDAGSGVDAYATSSSARPNGGGDPSVNSRQPPESMNISLPGSPAPSPPPYLFSPQEKLSKAEFHTNVHNLRKMTQDLLEKGYNEKGFNLSTMVKCLEKNSMSKDVPYCKWIMGMDSMVSDVGSSYCYWDLSTRIDYKYSSLSKNVFGLDIILDNKPKVSGDISLGIDDCLKLIAGLGWREDLKSKIELLCFGEHMALKLRASGSGSGRDFYIPKRWDIAAAVYGSWMKFGAEVSFGSNTRRSLSIGGAIQTNDFLASVIYWRDSLIGTCVKKFSSQFDMGIEISKPISSGRCTMTFGVCKSEPGHIYKMKINNFGVLNGSIERNLWPKAVVSVSSQVDLKNLLNCPRFGLKVLFNPPAVTQTYDIGKERWEKS